MFLFFFIYVFGIYVFGVRRQAAILVNLSTYLLPIMPTGMYCRAATKELQPSLSLTSFSVVLQLCFIVFISTATVLCHFFWPASCLADGGILPSDDMTEPPQASLYDDGAQGLLATLQKQVVVRNGPGPEDAKDFLQAFGVKDGQLCQVTLL